MTSPFPLFPPSVRVASPSPPGGAGVASTLRCRHDDSRESTRESVPEPEVVVVPNAGSRVTRGEQRQSNARIDEPGSRCRRAGRRAPSGWSGVSARQASRPAPQTPAEPLPPCIARNAHATLHLPRLAGNLCDAGYHRAPQLRVQATRVCGSRCGGPAACRNGTRGGMRSVRRDRPTHANSSLCFGNRQTPYWGVYHPQLRGVWECPMAYRSSNVSATRPGRSLGVVPFGTGRASADIARATADRRSARTRDCKCRYARVSANRRQLGHVVSVEPDRRRLRSGGAPRTNATLGTYPP